MSFVGNTGLAGLRTIVIALAPAAALAGCALPGQIAGLSNAPVDSSSPVAQDVLNAARHPGPYPKFAQIPQIPSDIRSVAQWRVAIGDIQQRQTELSDQVAALPPVDTNTEAYAAEARTRLGPPPAPPAAEDARQQTEAYARALRERATPPPPPK